MSDGPTIEDLQVKQHANRILHLLVDSVCAFLFFQLLLLAGHYLGANETLLVVMGHPALFSIRYALFCGVCEALLNGQTPGKMLTGLQVVMEDGRPVTLRAVLVRSLIRSTLLEVPFSLILPKIPHDILSGTKLVPRMKPAARPPVPAPETPGFESLLTEAVDAWPAANSDKRLFSGMIDHAAFAAMAFATFTAAQAMGIRLRWEVLPVYIAWFAVQEILWEGQTLGKMVARTRAVMADGSPLTVKAALQRSAYRLFIVLEWADLLKTEGQVVHDRLSDTKVVLAG